MMLEMSEVIMADDSSETGAVFDAEKNAKIYADFAERSQRIVNAFLERQQSGENYTVADPVEIGRLFMDASMKMMANPQKFAEAQSKLMQGYAELWQATAKRMSGEELPGMHRFCVYVRTPEEVDALVPILNKKGIPIVSGPEILEVAGNRSVSFLDPDGNRLEVACNANKFGGKE